MRFDYQLDQRLPILKSVLLGLQWAVIATSLIIILGQVAAAVHLDQPQDQITYLQKLFFVTAVSILVQVLWGHKLPVISGPSTIVLLGVLSSEGAGLDAVYTSVMVGGLLVTVLTLSGLFGYLRKLFTRRIVAVVLLLIAFTLAPTIVRLITSDEGGVTPLANVLFAVSLVAMMFVLHRVLTGLWKSTLMMWSMILGSLSYLLLFPYSMAPVRIGEAGLIRGFFSGLITRPSFEPGVLVAFVFCFIALSINDIGAIQSMEPLLNPADMAGRVKRGMTLTGLSNVLAGFFGVIGMVNFSLSPGIVISTVCASQFALVPAGLLILALSFSPGVIDLLDSVPSVVIGCVLLYIVASQFASGLVLAFQTGGDEPFDYDDGLIIGLPVLIGTVFAFLPAGVLDSFPVILRPILGNGFVMGVVSALVMEHLVFRHWRLSGQPRHGG
jgi:xanthine/uracil permease